MSPPRRHAFLVGLVAAAAASAQQAEPAAGLVALHQALLDASTDVVVMNVAAHPDDESSRTDAILRRKLGMRIVTVYTTYGDGGQNAIGREIGPELASLRVRETLRASAMSGVDVQWLGMPDFGFSKTLDETLAVWGADTLRGAMRAAVERIDPDVVITNHTLTQGHGHHRASFWAIREVLQERAKAGQFVPMLLTRCAVDKAQLVLDPSELDALRGETFARLAHRAWTQHVTQGPWGPHNPLQVGKDFWQAVAIDGSAAATQFEPATWGRERPGGAGLPADAVMLPRAELAKLARERLVALRAEMETLRADLRAPGARRRASLVRLQKDALERVVLALANVRVETWLEREHVPLGGNGKAFVVVHGHERTKGLAVRCGGAVGEPVRVTPRPTPFDGGTPTATTPTPQAPPATGAAPTDAPASAPPAAAGDAARVAPPPAPGRFSVEFPCEGELESDEPTGPEPRFCDVMIDFELDGLAFTVMASMPYTPMPPIELRWDREVLMVPRGQKVERLLSVAVRGFDDHEANYPVMLSMGPGITATTIPGRLTLSREHDEARVLVRATIEADELMPDAGLTFRYRKADARLPVRVVDVTVPDGMRVLLVRGPDDSTERALADLGVPFQALDRDGLLLARLEDYTAILLDIRAYHHRPELAEVRDRLLSYCRGGGRVVTMYHKSGEWNERAGHPQLAPFPMTIGEERITEENSAVTFLKPEHGLMRRPHALTPVDFTGWVQERGLNFPKTWDPAWSALLSMQDKPDEKAHDGALLHTQYGQGDFVYCSLALYRQLRLGHAGAARLLVNLLAR